MRQIRRQALEPLRYARQYTVSLRWQQDTPPHGSRGSRCPPVTTTLVESAPNVSEGRRRPVIDRLVGAAAGAPGCRLLDWSSDPAHNRTVLTLAGDMQGVTAALLALYEVAADTIDIERHHGVHPRVGAMDVVPLTPLARASMSDCVALAHALGSTVAERFGIPVFLYEDAASRPGRRALENIRRGQLAGLARRMDRQDWHPDFGPPAPHPTAGVTVIGARSILIAFNVNLATDDLTVARDIARMVRASGGGLPHVKAIGVQLGSGRVQVAMNLTNYLKTPLQRAFDAVRREAERRGVSIAGSELVGLVPATALDAAGADRLQLEHFGPERLLETHLGGRLTKPGGC